MRFLCLVRYRGRIQVGVGEARSRKKKLSVSVHVAGPRGPADTADPTMGLHFLHKVTHLCFDILLPESRLSEKHRYCHASVCYRSRFPHSTRNSQFLSFLSPKFELVPFLLLHRAVVFHFRSSLASLWLQKVWPHFISGWPLKKRSWLSAFDLNISGTQK
jgi:hypothetical protein